jgi:hypothetical protein
MPSARPSPGRASAAGPRVLLPDPAMPETTDLFNEIAIMRDELEEQGAVLDALVRAGDTADRVLDALHKDSVAARVLLAVDGSRSQTEIVNLLKSEGVPGASPATVSRKLKALYEDYGLIAPSHRPGAGNVYHRSRLDRALHISRQLEREAK